jgi:uncharacterized protein (DUF2141 family)
MINYLFILFEIVFVFGFQNAQAQNQKLEIQITNIKNIEGMKLWVAIFQQNGNFPDSGMHKIILIEAKNISCKTEFEIPFGIYAVSVYHDLKNNKKLDKNILGKPKEPFGFSKNFHPVLSAPDFQDCCFTFNQANRSITIELIE